MVVDLLMLPLIFSPSFAGYFASKGGAVSLPDGNKARTPTRSHRSPCGEFLLYMHGYVCLYATAFGFYMYV